MAPIASSEWATDSSGVPTESGRTPNRCSRPSAPRPVSHAPSPGEAPTTPKESRTIPSYATGDGSGAARSQVKARPSSPTPAHSPRRSAVTRPSISSSVQSIVLPPGTTVAPPSDPRPEVRKGFTITLAPVPSHDFPAVRLHIVTGKGGTGKSTVAAALALALASTGRERAAVRGRGPPGHRPDVRRRAPAVRRAPDRHRSGRAEGRAGRRGPRPAHRPGVGAAGVPVDVLQARPRREGARPLRGHRVRDHHRPRRPRRAADRQGLRGDPPQRPQPRRHHLRRRRARRAAHRSHRPVPRGQRRARRARQDGADQEPGRLGHPAVPFAADRLPPGDGPGGDARPGDRRRHRRAAPPRDPGRRGGRQPGPAARPGRGRPHRDPRQQGPEEGAVDRPEPGRAVAAPGPWSPACSPRPATMRSGGRSRTASVRWSRPSRCRRTSCPLLVGGIDLGGLYELAALLRDQGMA